MYFPKPSCKDWLSGGRDPALGHRTGGVQHFIPVKSQLSESQRAGLKSALGECGLHECPLLELHVSQRLKAQRALTDSLSDSSSLCRLEQAGTLSQSLLILQRLEQ